MAKGPVFCRTEVCSGSDQGLRPSASRRARRVRPPSVRLSSAHQAENVPLHDEPFHSNEKQPHIEGCVGHLCGPNLVAARDARGSYLVLFPRELRRSPHAQPIHGRQKYYSQRVRPSLARRVTLQYWHALCHANIASMIRDRLERAAAFIAQLHRLSAKTPHSWRRAESVGRDVGLAGLPLDQAIRDAEQAGLIHRRATALHVPAGTAKPALAGSGPWLPRSMNCRQVTMKCGSPCSTPQQQGYRPAS